MWDTAGQEEYDTLRPLSYPGTDICLICFSINSPGSLENAKQKWMPEIKLHMENTPVLLVGLKADLRTDENTIQSLKSRNQSPVTFSQGVRMARDIGAASYIECSAREQQGLRLLFDKAIEFVLCPEQPKTDSFFSWGTAGTLFSCNKASDNSGIVRPGPVRQVRPSPARGPQCCFTCRCSSHRPRPLWQTSSHLYNSSLLVPPQI